MPASCHAVRSSTPMKCVQGLHKWDAPVTDSEVAHLHGFSNRGFPLYRSRHMVRVRPCDPENEGIERSSYCPLLPPVWSRQSMGTHPGITAKGPIDAFSQHSKRHVTYKFFEKNILRTNSIKYVRGPNPGDENIFHTRPHKHQSFTRNSISRFWQGGALL